MPAFIIHEKLMSLGLTGRTEISLKSSLVICYYLSQAGGWWTRPVWRSLFPALRVQALSPTSTWPDFAGFPSQMKWEIGGSQAFFVKFVYCCVSRLWKRIWEQIDKWKEFISHWTADQCVNTLIDRTVNFPTSRLFSFLANNPALSCLGKWWGTVTKSFSKS